MQDPIESYVSKILNMRGEADTTEAHAKLSEEINDAIDQALIGALPLPQLDKLEAAAANDTVSDTLIEQLLKEAGVDSKKIIQDVLQKFQNNNQEGAKNE